MAKKRSCRRTEDERAIHEKAVTLRKMTDEQLIAAFNEEHDEGYADGYKAGKMHGGGNPASPPAEDMGERFIAKLESIRGIGTATIAKIRTAIQGGGQ